MDLLVNVNSGSQHEPLMTFQPLQQTHISTFPLQHLQSLVPAVSDVLELPARMGKPPSAPSGSGSFRWLKRACWGRWSVGGQNTSSMSVEGISRETSSLRPQKWAGMTFSLTLMKETTRYKFSSQLEPITNPISYGLKNGAAVMRVLTLNGRTEQWMCNCRISRVFVLIGKQSRKISQQVNIWWGRFLTPVFNTSRNRRTSLIPRNKPLRTPTDRESSA